MIEVVGGTYFELCLEPYWYEIFGSGGRAAVALSRLDDSISLTTYASKADFRLIEALAQVYKFELKTLPVRQTIRFEYLHGLSTPQIRPPVNFISPEKTHVVQAENILRFGFWESTAEVHGKKVVYDPQNARNPDSFGKNGSTAERLAVVANYGECLKMTSQTGTVEPQVLGQMLIEKEGAETIVIKQGSLGATVVTSEEFKTVPAFRTNKVWTIGSGDVFASVFAHFWTTGKADSFEAAHLASLATAYYCETKKLPIPSDFDSTFNPLPLERRNDFPKTPKKVYLAGPFFTMAQRWVIQESRKYLNEQHFEVFSPFHDIGYGTAAEVVPADIKALDECDLVFAILDGLDAGTLFEVGYARSRNKPVIAFVQNESPENLKMLEGTSCEIVDDFVSAIYRTTWAAYQL